MGYPPPDPALPVAERLDVAHKRIEQTRTDLDRAVRQASSDRVAAQKATEAEAEARAADVDFLRRLTRELAVGGLRLGAFGVLLLVVGVVLATWAPELASWLPKR